MGAADGQRQDVNPLQTLHIHDTGRLISLNGLIAGLATQSIMWGPWALGMVATDARIAGNLCRAGLTMLTPASGLRLLSAVLKMTASIETVAAHIQWSSLLHGRKHVPDIFADCVASLPAAAPQKALTQRPAPLQFLRVSTGAAALPQQHALCGIVAEAVRNMLGHDVAPDEVSCSCQVTHDRLHLIPRLHVPKNSCLYLKQPFYCQL